MRLNWNHIDKEDVDLIKKVTNESNKMNFESNKDRKYWVRKQVERRLNIDTFMNDKDAERYRNALIESEDPHGSGDIAMASHSPAGNFKGKNYEEEMDITVAPGKLNSDIVGDAIAHEMGHSKLKHKKRYPNSSLSNNSVNNFTPEYIRQELEAQWYAYLHSGNKESFQCIVDILRDNSLGIVSDEEFNKILNEAGEYVAKKIKKQRG